MPERIATFLATKPSAECARLIGNFSKYVHDDRLVNLVTGFDVNNHKKNMKFKYQLLSFSNIPGIKEQVDQWMSS
jgi:hypothetical protein